MTCPNQAKASLHLDLSSRCGHRVNRFQTPTKERSWQKRLVLMHKHGKDKALSDVVTGGLEDLTTGNEKRIAGDKGFKNNQIERFASIITRHLSSPSLITSSPSSASALHQQWLGAPNSLCLPTPVISEPPKLHNKNIIPQTSAPSQKIIWYLNFSPHVLSRNGEKENRKPPPMHPVESFKGSRHAQDQDPN
ncbi:uncharacterized protein BDR25DRAFT_351305 [Lindgomyces ingoldianus]|uniref:Uncharacterized protein n=1 Tax=Lindgomyces ingoldianus TaxID=673940 RepID=A0ACB6R680_9PLEO|nr:uncharacterized protein BDR25DRAFT_351305 [Lindgomyces ingoldianus]KAF2474798.1 hypothetical protein BDR25DRAFT_351305 [Lindgomyces ingoldianus]